MTSESTDALPPCPNLTNLPIERLTRECFPASRASPLELLTKKPCEFLTRRAQAPVGVQQRSARDSNPQALSGARFRGECNTILPALQTAKPGYPRADRAEASAPRARTVRSNPDDIKKPPPPAALPIGAPGFEPGTSATRTQRSTGLSHAPEPTRVNQCTDGLN